MVGLLQRTDFVLLNPRRKDFPFGDLTAAKQQIKWEHAHLRLANVIAFWFPSETICPIGLYELGAWSMTDKQIHIGLHPEYPRRIDVEVQIGIARPDVKIVYSLADLAKQIIESYSRKESDKAS